MIFIPLLLAFQLENYEAKRFLIFAYTHLGFWIFGGERQKLVWTQKAYALFFGCIGMFLLIIGFTLWGFLGGVFGKVFGEIGLIISGIIFILMCVIYILIVPVFYVITNILLWPLDEYLKTKILEKARKKLQKHPNIFVIGITGSYGKTSQKEILAYILGKQTSVLMSEGNKNTPLGVAHIILEKLSCEHRVFIVEMGAYKRGNIRELCDLVKPKMGILTGITKQHLERFGSLEAIVDTKFELLESLPKEGVGFVNSTSEPIAFALKAKKKKICASIRIFPVRPKYCYLPNYEGIEFDYQKTSCRISFLAPHNLDYLLTSLSICTYLGYDYDKKTLQKTCQTIPQISHRLEVIKNKNTGVIILDDSYNGNIEGVRATISLVEKVPFSGRKLYLTPGLVELGNEMEQIHYMLGQELAYVFDQYILIDTPATRALAKGMRDQGVKQEKIIWYTSALEAHKNISSLLKSGDMIIFQNDWSDTYF